jgi:hypothetical protein
MHHLFSNMQVIKFKEILRTCNVFSLRTDISPSNGLRAVSLSRKKQKLHASSVCIELGYTQIGSSESQFYLQSRSLDFRGQQSCHKILFSQFTSRIRLPSRLLVIVVRSQLGRKQVNLLGAKFECNKGDTGFRFQNFNN